MTIQFCYKVYDGALRLSTVNLRGSPEMQEDILHDRLWAENDRLSKIA